ncbi:XRE family transcriptional regulator [Moraxella catarrhalis]|uniref:XRE family transcriptional regulator n=1 Tax=Moraxella catarrhalis TaxID=480 RepID=UPI00128DCD00|nr:helix-turn-helix transcriptional regulator [Moraxella catarrhalis]MPW54137.1 helix-turn-helix transcriptional regulator [Moraxella catarrhalis]MPX79051.1 peptidase S24 [Moraxella catarrhalis]
MGTLGDRLKVARENKNLSQQEVAERAGMSQPTYYKIESGKTKRTTYLNDLARVLGVNPNWLATGEGSIHPLQSNISPNFESVDDWGNDTPLEPDEVEIPFYKDFSVACGHGTDLVVMENEKRRLRFSRLTLDRIGSHKDKVFATLAEGDSMSPTINDKDTIWIDESKTSIKDGKIFVFEYGGLCMCKRLYRLPNNGLKIVSDNTIDYPEWEITGEQKETNGFRLIGWVFHWSVMDSW